MAKVTRCEPHLGPRLYDSAWYEKMCYQSGVAVSRKVMSGISVVYPVYGVV